MKSKDNAYDVFSNFCTQIHSEKEMKIIKVRNDHGGEFENEPFEAEILKIKKDFELFKKEHASSMNEQFTIPPKESPSINAPKSPKSKNIGTCEACPRLQLEIVSLKSKIEQASNTSINFAKRSPKITNSQLKKPSKKEISK